MKENQLPSESGPAGNGQNETAENISAAIRDLDAKLTELEIALKIKRPDSTNLE